MYLMWWSLSHVATTLNVIICEDVTKKNLILCSKHALFQPTHLPHLLNFPTHWQHLPSYKPLVLLRPLLLCYRNLLSCIARLRPQRADQNFFFHPATSRERLVAWAKLLKFVIRSDYGHVRPVLV